MTGAINKNTSLFILLGILFIVSVMTAAYTEQFLFAAIPFVAVLVYIGWQNRNLVFLLLLFTLPLSFEYNFSPNLGTDVPDEVLMLLVAGVFIAYWVYSPAAISAATLRHPLLVLLLASLVWMTTTVLFSTEPVVSLKFLLAKCWYIAAFVLAPLFIFKEKKFIRTAVVTITASMLLITLVILVKHSADSFRFASINEAAAPFFRNHVNYSAMLVCFIPVLVAFLNGSKTREQKIVIIAAILVALIALFFSYARGAWVALLVGGIAYWMIKKRTLLYGYVLAIIIAIAALFWLKNDERYLKYASDYNTTIFHTDFGEHLVATYQLKDVSTAERFYRRIAGVRMIKDNWLTGYGPNTFYDNYADYTVPLFKTWVSNNTDHSTVHNYFLLTAIEQGLPGLIFLLILCGAMLYYAQYLYHRISDNFYRTTAITTGIIISMILVVNLLSDLIETDKIGSLFFLCLATLVVTDINTRKRSNSSSDIQRIS